MKPLAPFGAIFPGTNPMTTSVASLPAVFRPRQVLSWFGVAPFFVFATLFLILPTLAQHRARRVPQR